MQEFVEVSFLFPFFFVAVSFALNVYRLRKYFHLPLLVYSADAFPRLFFKVTLWHRERTNKSCWFRLGRKNLISSLPAASSACQVLLNQETISPCGR